MWSPVQEGTRARQSAPHLLPHPLLRVMWKDIPVACEHCDAKGKSVRTETKRKGHVFLVSYPFCPRQKPHVFPRTVVCKPPPPQAWVSFGSVSWVVPLSVLCPTLCVVLPDSVRFTTTGSCSSLN